MFERYGKQILLVGIWMLHGMVYGQFKNNPGFSISEENKFVYYEVVQISDTIPVSELYRRAREWVVSTLADKEDKIIFENALAAQIEATNSFLVYTTGMITKPIHGKIHYKINIELRQGKYRFFFHDFQFEYFKQDRQTLKYLPTKRFKPLEDEKMPGFSKSWAKHKQETYERVKKQATRLKDYMLLSKQKYIQKADTLRIKSDGW